MSKLGQLRGRLAALRRARRSARWGTGLCAIGIALLATLAGLFVLDLYFELSVAQRLLMFVVAIGTVIWATKKYAAPYFQPGESIEALALQVERQHSIPSDLIAALQFESPAASLWGSTALEERVISRVAQTSPTLDVFAGFSRETMLRRVAIFLVMLAAAILGGFLFPEYARVFGERLLLGNVHYPTATVIEQIQVGHVTVYERSAASNQPESVNLPQSQSVPFVIGARGATPPGGYLIMRDSSGREREVPLDQISLDTRRQRLDTALELLETNESTEPQRLRAASLLQADAPDLAEKLREENNAQITTALKAQLAAWPEDRYDGVLYTGELPRLIASVDYQVYLGDAWTDSAAINMISLPVVELEYRITPPSYAVAGEQAQRVELGARRISVLEGSRVDLVARCVNDKELEKLTLTIHDQSAAEESPAQQISFEKVAGEESTWAYMPQEGPLAAVDRQLQLSVTCRDSDGLTLEAPLTCWVHLEADRAPTASASVVHKVVLPDAAPVVEYRVADDYAIGSVILLVDVERAKDLDEFGREREPIVPADVDADDENAIGRSRAGERHEVAIAPVVDSSIITGPWPHVGKHALDLSPFSLVKGDHLKLTLQVTDYRGEREGETIFSDPLIVEVSDESGVLAAISEADQRSEERLNELIKRQLGIGESP